MSHKLIRIGTFGIERVRTGATKKKYTNTDTDEPQQQDGLIESLNVIEVVQDEEHNSSFEIQFENSGDISHDNDNGILQEEEDVVNVDSSESSSPDNEANEEEVADNTTSSDNEADEEEEVDTSDEIEKDEEEVDTSSSDENEEELFDFGFEVVIRI